MAAKTPKYLKEQYEIRTVAATGPVFTSDQTVLVDTTAGVVTLNLPPAASMQGNRLTIKIIAGTNELIIDGDSAETIEGYVTFSLTTVGDTLTITSDGSNWMGINSNRNKIVDYVTLSGNLGASATGIASLAYSNLVVGKRYRVCPYIMSHTAGNAGQNAAKTLIVIHDGNTIASAALLHNGSGGGDTGGASLQTSGEVFVATTTSLSANFSMGTSTTLYGNGTTLYTHYYIEDMDAI